MDRLQQPKPSWRNAAGIAFILLLIVAWSVLVVTGAALLGERHWAVWVLYYTVAGIVWVLPLRPLLRWMNSGG